MPRGNKGLPAALQSHRNNDGGGGWLEMGVKLVGDATELFLPYKSTVSDAAVGSAVWVAKIYGSWRNAIVWDKI